MPCRSRLIASTRSSRSAVSLMCCVSTSRSSSSARRLTAPIRSRSRRSFSRSASTVATSGSAAFGSISASAATPSGSTSSISLISWAMSDTRRLAPSSRSVARGGFLAGGAERLERGAHRAVALPQHALGLLQPVAGLALGLLRLLDFADHRIALFGEQRRRVLQRHTLVAGLLAARLQRGNLRERAVAAIAPLLAVGGDGVEAAVGELGLAGERLRFGAHLRGVVALDLDVGADRGELFLDLGGGRERGERCFGLLLAGARLVAAGGEPGLGFVERGDPRGVAGDLALRGGVQFTGCVGLLLRGAPPVAGAGFRRRGRRRPSPLRLRRRRACRRRRRARRASSPSMSASRPRSARRRAAPVGACASAAKPSQRHRSPSRDTSRWPGFSMATRPAASARATTPICARRRASSGGAVTCRDSGSAPCGSAGSVGSIAAPVQRIGEDGSAGASRSSPSAAPSAFS